MVYFLALLSPFMFALGTVLQQRGTLQTRAGEGNPRFLVQMFRRPVWLLGGFVAVCAWGLQAAALHYGSLVLVQALQALCLVFALPLGVRLTDQHVTRRSVLAAGLVVAGLATFIVLGQPRGGIDQPSAGAWLVGGLSAVAVVGGLTSLALRFRGPRAAALFGTGAGICYGLQAAFTKVVVTELNHGLGAIFTDWPLYALAVIACAGFALDMTSLKTGSLAPAMAGIDTATLGASVLFGVALFKEGIWQSNNRVAPAVAGLVLAVVGVVLLALARVGRGQTGV